MSTREDRDEDARWADWLDRIRARVCPECQGRGGNCPACVGEGPEPDEDTDDEEEAA